MSFTPETPTTNFGMANSGGGAAVGRTDPNAMMLQMGLSYGQTLLQQQIQQGEAGLARYMPFIYAIRNYFVVDHAYVKRKLMMLTFPFFTKYVRKPLMSGEGDFGGGGGCGGGGGDAAGDNAFSGFTSSPANMYPAGSPSSRVGWDVGNVAAGIPLPVNDVFAADLYIPLMSIITYVVLAAFIDGANSAQSEITAESLVSTAWVIGIWFLLEIVVLKGMAYTFRVAPNLPLLELLALCGYKYVLLCIGVLVSQGLPPGRLYYGLVLLYGLVAHSFFTVRVVGLRYIRDDGRIAPRSRMFTFVAAAAQVPAYVWMFVKPLLQ